MATEYRKFRITLQLKTPEGDKKAVYEVDVDNNSIKDVMGIDYRTLEQKDAVHQVLFKMIEFLRMKIDWQIIKVQRLDETNVEIKEIKTNA